MGVFNSFGDSPLNHIKSIGKNITIKFVRDAEDLSTGYITWNIPTSMDGCTDESQIPYCGIVITANTAANKSDVYPHDGEMYQGDPTVDIDKHTGSKIGPAFVVGAFYNDKTTTSLTIYDLDPETPYFISGYPLDCQLRHYKAGVHAFALDKTNANADYSYATPIKVTVSNNTILTPNNTVTWDPTQYYSIKIKYNDDVYCLNFTDVRTYNDLITKLNTEFKKLSTDYHSEAAPNTGLIYNTKEGIMQWDGNQYNQLAPLSNNEPPNNIEYWYNPTNRHLSWYSNYEWQDLNDTSRFIYSQFDIRDISCSFIWIDLSTSTLYLRENGRWLVKPSIFTDNNPLDDTELTCNTYWYNPDTRFLSIWNIDVRGNKWVDSSYIRTKNVPGFIDIGQTWFDTANNKLFIYTAAQSWDEVACIIDEQEPVQVVDGLHWYNPTTRWLVKYDLVSDSWNLQDTIVYSCDPSASVSGDLWLNAVQNTLHTYNAFTQTWDELTDLLISGVAPTTRFNIEDGTYWYNNTNLFVLDCGDWKPVTDYIAFNIKPLSLIPGTVWYNGTKFYVLASYGWVEITPLFSETDPRLLDTGTLWYNTTNQTLYSWDGLGWVVMSVASTTLPHLHTHTLWYNPVDDTLKWWEDKKWVETDPFIVASIDSGKLAFTSKAVGSQNKLMVYTNSAPYDECQNINALYGWVCNTVEGQDELTKTPTYDVLGVGTDGTDDERKSILDQIRMKFGYPTVSVELTNQQLDYCLNTALSVFRQKSAYAYKRAFLFLRTQAGQQRYILTNKTRGYNKIVNILGIYRWKNLAFQSSSDMVWNQLFIQYFYSPVGPYDTLTYDLLVQYIKNLEVMFARKIVFTFDEYTRELHMLQRFAGNDILLMEVMLERTEQELFVGRESKEWIKKYAIASAASILAQIRGKYSNLPTAGGGTSLNASDLISMSTELHTECEEALENHVADGYDQLGICDFSIG